MSMKRPDWLGNLIFAALFLGFCALAMWLTGCGHGSPLLPTVDRCGRPVVPPLVACRDFLGELPVKRLTEAETRAYDVCWRDGECFYRCQP